MKAFTSQEQVGPAFGIESAQSEANENNGGSHESRHDDAEEKETTTKTLKKRFIGFERSQNQNPFISPTVGLCDYGKNHNLDYFGQ